jgi:hypothetical protein
MYFNMVFYKINPTGIAAEIFGSEVVLMNLYKGNYYCFRGETAVQIWQLLEQPIATHQIVTLLAQAYQHTTSEMSALVEPFLAQLLAEQLIMVTAPAESLKIPSFIPTEPMLMPQLEVYDDMQELILLDPIHDVDPEEGWPKKK